MSSAMCWQHGFFSCKCRSTTIQPAMPVLCCFLSQEALLESPSDYKSFNDFFYRKLKPEARPIASPADPSVVVSAADCRWAGVLWFEADGGPALQPLVTGDRQKERWQYNAYTASLSFLTRSAG